MSMSTDDFILLLFICLIYLLFADYHALLFLPNTMEQSQSDWIHR